MFGRKAATVVTPLPTPSQPEPDTVATAGLETLREAAVAGPELQLQRDVALLADELVWLKERFGKLQNRVTAELREIRREVDRLYDAPEEETDGLEE